MATTGVRRRLQRVSLDRETARWLAVAVALEVLVIVTYVTVFAATITNPLILVYPFVWIDVALLAAYTTTPPPVASRRRLVGLAIAAGYLVVLGYFGGLFGLGQNMVPLHVDWRLPPGYGPALLYDGPTLRLILEPYKVVGYLTLAYLVYTTVLDAAGSAVSGVVGLFSCVSCSWPIIGAIATSFFGSGSAIAAFAFSRSYALGTLVFVSAVALLYYRPTLGRR